MTKSRFEKTSLETARERIGALFAAYCKSTGLPITIVSEIVSDDRAFVSRYKSDRLNFATYDRIAGRFSEIWPEGRPWPDAIPRPAPIKLPEQHRKGLDTRLAKLAEARLPPSPRQKTKPAAMEIR